MYIHDVKLERLRPVGKGGVRTSAWRGPFGLSQPAVRVLAAFTCFRGPSAERKKVSRALASSSRHGIAC